MAHQLSLEIDRLAFKASFKLGRPKIKNQCEISFEMLDMGTKFWCMKVLWLQ